MLVSHRDKMELPLWSLVPALAILTGIFFILPHMDYSFMDWLIGNGVIGLGITFIYGGEFIYKKVKR